MRSLLFAAVFIAGCTKNIEPLTHPQSELPTEVPTTAYHAIRCGSVTAQWDGDDHLLRELHVNNPSLVVPKSYGARAVNFTFSDHQTLRGTGELQPQDWRFDIFSPNCEYVALLTDRAGPFHVVKLADLESYLHGQSQPTIVTAPTNQTASIVSEGTWLTDHTFEFFASCCGGVEVFHADLSTGKTDRVFFAAEAPKGIRRAQTSFEVIK